jgi:anaerobic selenocysteine-containing dehydrogenase
LTYARSTDRLVYPMRRTGRKGSGEVIRISWDEALERIAAELGDVIAKHGAEAIWPYAGSGNMGLMQGIYGAGERLWNVLGTSRGMYTMCTIAGGFGTGYTLGDNRVGMDPETFRFSKLVVLWGANVLSTHPHLWRPILEARKSGAVNVKNRLHSSLQVSEWTRKNPTRNEERAWDPHAGRVWLATARPRRRPRRIFPWRQDRRWDRDC